MFVYTFSDSDMSTTPPGSPSSSSCIESSSSLTPSEIADKLRDKLTPMRRNRRLMTDDITLLTSPRHSSTSLSFQPQQSDAMNVESISTGCKEQTAVEKPVFTLQQMTLVCERLCKVSNHWGAPRIQTVGLNWATNGSVWDAIWILCKRCNWHPFQMKHFHHLKPGHICLGFKWKNLPFDFWTISCPWFQCADNLKACKSKGYWILSWLVIHKVKIVHRWMVSE